jgi:protoheme IX farnesyltransferase
MSGWLYLAGSLLIGGRFLQWAIKLYRTDKPVVAMQTFRYSIVYLMLLFVFLLLDHYI